MPSYCDRRIWIAVDENGWQSTKLSDECFKIDRPKTKLKRAFAHSRGSGTKWKTYFLKLNDEMTKMGGKTYIIKSTQPVAGGIVIFGCSCCYTCYWGNPSLWSIYRRSNCHWNNNCRRSYCYLGSNCRRSNCHPIRSICRWSNYRRSIYRRSNNRRRYCRRSNCRWSTYRRSFCRRSICRIFDNLWCVRASRASEEIFSISTVQTCYFFHYFCWYFRYIVCKIWHSTLKYWGGGGGGLYPPPQRTPSRYQCFSKKCTIPGHHTIVTPASCIAVELTMR